MNETSATASQSGASLLPDGIGAITAVHMVFMVLVAIAAIAIIVAGIRRKRIRTQAERQVRTNAREAGMMPSASEQQPTEEPTPVIEAPTPPVPTPTPAPPPPIATAPVAATPQEPVAPPPPPAEPVSDPIPEPAPLADEPIAAAAPFDATPASVAADTPPAPDPVPAPTPAPVDATDPADTPVTQLKGLGPKLATRLAGHGITTVGDLAALSDEQAQALDAQLGPFTGRMSRDRWLEQARLLATGDRAGFEAVFGRL